MEDAAWAQLPIVAPSGWVPMQEMEAAGEQAWAPSSSWPPDAWGWAAAGAARAWPQGPAEAAPGMPDSRPIVLLPVPDGMAQQTAAPAAAPEQKAAAPAQPAAPAGGKGVRRATQPGGMSRQQYRLQQRRQRELEQGRIKGLEQQLLALRQQLESLSIENSHLKQRQAALNATLDMQQQLQAAAEAAARAASGSLGSLSEAGGEEEAASIALDPAGSLGLLADNDFLLDGEAAADAHSEMDDGAVDNMLDELAASAEQEASCIEAAVAGGGAGAGNGAMAAGAAGGLAAGPGGSMGGQQADAGMQVGSFGSGPVLLRAFSGSSVSGMPERALVGGSTWFFSATLAQHVQWYRKQVDRLSELLAVLEAIPPRLQRSLEDYKLHEETMDAVQAVLSDIDNWTIHLAALRADDFGVVLHNNLQDVLDGLTTTTSSTAASGAVAGASGAAVGTSQAAAPRPASCGSASDGDGSDGGGGGGPGGSAAAGGREGRAQSTIWQELVEELALTPQQEQTLEAHQALFEQREAALEGSKAAVLTALSNAARRDDKDAARDLLQGTEALKASLQHDMLLKAPVMISLRKVLTPMQMARLTVNCWPFYTTMKNISRAHKQRRLAGHTTRRR